MSPRLRKYASIASRLLFSGLGAYLLIHLLRSVSTEALLGAVSRVPRAVVAAVALGSLAATTAQGLRFHALYPCGLPPLHHVALNFALQASNSLLPLRGGELLRPLYLLRRRPGTGLRTLVLWSVVDRIFDVSSLLPFVVAAAVVFRREPALQALQRWLPWLGGLLVIGGAGFAMLRLRRALRRSGAALPYGGAVLRALGFALLAWCANYAQFYCVMRDGRLALALLIGVHVALALPGLPAGIGPFEAAFVWVGQMGGLPQEQVLAAALVTHTVRVLAVLAVGAPVLAMLRWQAAAAPEKAPDQAAPAPDHTARTG